MRESAQNSRSAKIKSELFLSIELLPLSQTFSSIFLINFFPNLSLSLMQGRIGIKLERKAKNIENKKLRKKEYRNLRSQTGNGRLQCELSTQTLCFEPCKR